MQKGQHFIGTNTTKTMNKYNPNIHHRKSIRLKGYDYSQAGLYFITICCQDRARLFGNIVGAENLLPNTPPSNKPKMLLKDAGKIADACWLEIPKHFPNAILHEYIVMPNHIHDIIELLNENNNEQTVRAENFLTVQPRRNEFLKIIPCSIGSIVRGFKIGVTKWFRQNTVWVNKDLPIKLWPRNYYEYIIRDEQSYLRISKYIINNPAK